LFEDTEKKLTGSFFGKFYRLKASHQGKPLQVVFLFQGAKEDFPNQGFVVVEL